MADGDHPADPLIDGLAPQFSGTEFGHPEIDAGSNLSPPPSSDALE
jgi:hypothetical protein